MIFHMYKKSNLTNGENRVMKELKHYFLPKVVVGGICAAVAFGMSAAAKAEETPKATNTAKAVMQPK